MILTSCSPFTLQMHKQHIRAICDGSSIAFVEKGERVARVATTNKLTEPTEPTKRGTG